MKKARVISHHPGKKDPKALYLRVAVQIELPTGAFVEVTNVIKIDATPQILKKYYAPGMVAEFPESCFE